MYHTDGFLTLTGGELSGGKLTIDTTNYHIAGNLTIRWISNPVELDAEILNEPGDTLRATGKLVIDRTKYNMKFRSGNFFMDLGDTLIYNDFTLNILLAAKSV